MSTFKHKDRILLFQILFISSISATSNHNTVLQVDHFTISKPQADNKSCPPWKYHKYHNSSCVCGDPHDNTVVCEDDQPAIKLLTCHCMTYSDYNNMTLVGNCPYLCTDSVYMEIHNHTDITNLCNHVIQQNRLGQMCGKCVDNFAPSPHSYTFECTDCSDYEHNWIKYVLISYLPLTMLFILVIVFRFNAMSAKMNSFILISQVVGCPAAMSLLVTYVKFAQMNPTESEVVTRPGIKILSFIYGIWNLDFFCILYKPLCLHPNMSVLQILSLNFATALYPLSLISATYFLIKIHDRFRPFQLLWKPARWLFTCISYQWTTNALIQAFGTFFLLSYVRTMNTSLDLLMPVQLYNVSGKVVGWYLYYNGSLEYFGNDHLPYAVLAIFMFVTFNLLPLLLLCLYPCRCFQSCLNRCRLNSQVLRTFMDAFQGCYKFEPYDCRCWAAFYLFLRIAFLGIFALTQSGYCFLVSGILLIPVVALLAVVRPYKQNIYNIIDILMFITIIQLCFSATGFALSVFDRTYSGFSNVMFGSAFFFPIIYIIVLLLKCLIPRKLMAAAKKHLQLLITLCKDNQHMELSTAEETHPLLRDYDNREELGDSHLNGTY